ncbi:hypothetical protein Q3G72_032962 [Acer saccharum]|nr:hypothetical protein Q3G72_032962 [Acer saccharum]
MMDAVVVVVVPGRGARASFSSVDFTQGPKLDVVGVQKLVPHRAVVEDLHVHRKLLLCLAGDSGAPISQIAPEILAHRRRLSYDESLEFLGVSVDGGR